jgi:hypothetical protein
MNSSQQSPDTFILASYYFNKIVNLHSLEVNKYSLRYLIVTAYWVAIKFVNDVTSHADFLVKFRFMTKTELAEMEILFLSLIDFNLYVYEDEFNKYISEILAM